MAERTRVLAGAKEWATGSLKNMSFNQSVKIRFSAAQRSDLIYRAVIKSKLVFLPGSLTGAEEVLYHPAKRFVPKKFAPKLG